MKRMFLLLLFVSAAAAQVPSGELRWRLIGPFRGGRSVAVAGSPTQPNVYYFGGTGGGIFKTTDGGARWEPVTDGQLGTGSVGAIAVAPSDPNVIFAGMGESCIRGNASHGDGVYKSSDAGRTWKKIGLEDTQQIGRIAVHPKNPDIVFVAALGHQFGPNEQRGVFRSTDGGKTWKQSLTRGPKAGAVDISMDPANPNVLYAAFWETYRTPYGLESGGPGSGIWKSIDGGETWRDLSRAPGLPRTVLGRIGIAVSPANPERVYAIVEAEEGGVFRSDNGGANWIRVNQDRNLRQRAWYYTHIYADPQQADTMYVLNTGFYRSQDGGRTYSAIPTPHGDNHDLWIAPGDPQRMINANDGGANVSYNGGRTWSPQNNQPTAQFYRLALDNEFPYNAYGAQQDNSTVRIATRSPEGGAITERDWYDVGGGESGWIAPDPRDTSIVFAGSYGGLLTRYDHRTRVQRNVSAWPDNPMGHGAAGLKYRFQWNFPIVISPHDPKVLYAAANVLFRSTNEGASWEAVSGDLTRNDKSKQGPSGGPITKDNTSVEYYCTIFTIAESPVSKGVIWTGSDDGLVHVTRDGGKTWTKATPPDMPEWAQINSIEASPHDAGMAFFAATRYKSDDHRPLLYKTTDFGKTWTKIVAGIPANAFTRVIREDPNRKGLLAAGTETGLFMSMNGGDSWQSMQFNLPVVPITDLQFHKREKELVAATQGRSFWIFDDLPFLYQWTDAARSEDVRLFQPKDAYRGMGGGRGGGGRRGAPTAGQGPASGAVLYYWLKDRPQGEVKLEFLDSAGKVVNTYTSRAPQAPGGGRGGGGIAAPEEGGGFGFGAGPARVAANQGLNRFVWDLRYPDAARFPGLIMWAGSTSGPPIVPGNYQVKLTAGGKTLTQPLVVAKDPRWKSTNEDLSRQLQLSLQIRDKLTQANDAVVTIRELRSQVQGYATRLKDDPAGKKVVDAANALAKKLTEVEEELYQTKNQSSQDPLNYPIRVNNKLAALLGVVQASDTAPTAQSNVVFEELASVVNVQLKKLDGIVKTDVEAFNKLVRESNIPAVTVKPKSPAE